MLKEVLEDNSNKVILVVGLVIFLKLFLGSSLFKTDMFKGDGFTIKFPENWVMNEELTQRKSYKNDINKEMIVFETPDADLLTKESYARIVISTIQLDLPVWIEDEFPKILDALKQSGVELIDKGQIKIDERIFRWVFYNDKRLNLLTIEFYYVDDANKLFKIQYMADDQKFNDYRQDFETAKETLKLKGFKMTGN